MSSDNIAIRVRGLGKKYTLGGPHEHYHTIRDAIVNAVKAPFRRFNGTPAAEQNCSRYVFALSHGMIKTAISQKGVSSVVPKVSKKRLNKTVCVVGLGYVALPLAEAFSEHLRTI